jgi:ribosomal protein S18 acetylase RimI-like enzyme
MVEITILQASDYEHVLALWQATDGLTLRAADSPEGFARYLERNPDLSFIARDGSVLVGTVLGGHDGRRGYLQHLAVAPSHRGRGVGRALVDRALAALAERGIRKSHVMVNLENRAGQAFWAHLGWTPRDDLVLLSHVEGSDMNA